jgi:MoaA/NifB/PqqE/SkfB family radical SAM enzyme
MSAPYSGIIKCLTAFAGPFLAYNLAGRITPVLAGYKVTHKCNLKCLHCPYWKRSGNEQSFGGALSTLQRLRSMGAKILIIEGGEPLLWRDGEKTISDLVQQARKLFPSVCTTTNGAIPWQHIPFDRVWISLDGPPAVHDSIRGKGTFHKVWKNLEQSDRDKTLVSTTINQINLSSIPELLTMLRGLIAGVTIQFHYPYSGLPDPLFVQWSDRREILDELIRLKRLGYPVANSVASLRELKLERWTCEEGLLANAEPDGTIHHGCYLKNRGIAECSFCGFAAHNEMSLAFKMKWQSVRTGMKIFFMGARQTSLP